MKDGKYFIGFNDFGNKQIKKTGLLDVINDCTIKDNKVYYLNKDGNQIVSIDEFNNKEYLYLVDKKDIDVKDSLWKWFRQGDNCKHSAKEFILDETINNDSQIKPINYKDYCWHFTLLMVIYDDCIKYNIIKI